MSVYLFDEQTELCTVISDMISEIWQFNILYVHMSPVTSEKTATMNQQSQKGDQR